MNLVWDEAPKHVPPEIWINIFQHLDTRSLKQVLLACCLFKDLAKPILWQAPRFRRANADSLTKVVHCPIEIIHLADLDIFAWYKSPEHGYIPWIDVQKLAPLRNILARISTLNTIVVDTNDSMIAIAFNYIDLMHVIALPYKVVLHTRSILFVHNHDHKYRGDFFQHLSSELESIDVYVDLNKKAIYEGFGLNSKSSMLERAQQRSQICYDPMQMVEICLPSVRFVELSAMTLNPVGKDHIVKILQKCEKLNAVVIDNISLEQLSVEELQLFIDLPVVEVHLSAVELNSDQDNVLPEIVSTLSKMTYLRKVIIDCNVSGSKIWISDLTYFSGLSCLVEVHTSSLKGTAEFFSSEEVKDMADILHSLRLSKVFIDIANTGERCGFNDQRVLRDFCDAMYCNESLTSYLGNSSAIVHISSSFGALCKANTYT